MSSVMRGWKNPLERWLDAGLIDATVADRIRSYEHERDRSSDREWPALLAWIFGGVLLCAGVLLFVAAHWDRLSSASRFTLVLLMVAAFHVAGSLVRDRANVLAIVLHAAGTVTLGSGIFLAGQIFHLQEHWPGGVMLWAAGAWIAWALLRDSIQMALAAVLTPIWLAGEWIFATEHMIGGERILPEGLWLLGLAYFTARGRGRDDSIRQLLTWIGGIALIPLTFWVILPQVYTWNRNDPVPIDLIVIGWIIALCIPLGLAFLLRQRGAWPVAVGGLWVVLLGLAAGAIKGDHRVTFDWNEITTYALCALASILMAWWGFIEGRGERINLGVLGFGLTVLLFYFASLMDKLGRSLSLIVLGLLFLIGGYLLERARRTLISKLSGTSP